VAWLSSLSRRTWVLEATERASLITACQSTALTQFEFFGTNSIRPDARTTGVTRPYT
jgi:hypothetical protein